MLPAFLQNPVLLYSEQSNIEFERKRGDIIKLVLRYRDNLKKAFTILSYGLSGSITCFPMPSSSPFASPNTVLPWFKFDSSNPSTVDWGKLRFFSVCLVYLIAM